MHTTARLLVAGDIVIGIGGCNEYCPVLVKAARIAELKQIGIGQLIVHRADIRDQSTIVAALAYAGVDRIVPVVV